MNKDKGSLFERALQTITKEGEPLLDNEEQVVASSVLDFAHKAIYKIGPDDFEKDSITSFDEKIEAALIKFEAVFKVFKESRDSKDKFLNSFDLWAELCPKIIKDLREIAKELQTDKFKRNMVRGIGNAAAAVGGVLAIAPCAPLVVGGVLFVVGNGAAILSEVGESSYEHQKMKEAETKINEERKSYSAMRWFSCSAELEQALNSLVSCKVLEIMAEKVDTFSKLVRDKKDMTDDAFKNHYEEVLKYCMEQMAKDSKMIKDYGKELAPAVMTFVFVVCLMNDHNRIVMNSSFKTLHLTSRVTGFPNLCSLGAGAISLFIFRSFFVYLGVAINVQQAWYSFIDAYKRPDTELTKEIKEAADKLEGIYLYIKGVYNATKQYKSHDEVTQWKSILVNQTPDAAESVDFEMAVKDYIPEKAWGRIRTLKLPTANMWLVMVPTIHSQRLVQLKQIEIKGKICEVSL